MTAQRSEPSLWLHPENMRLANGLYNPLEEATDGQVFRFVEEVFPTEVNLGQAALYSTLARETLISLPSTDVELVRNGRKISEDAAILTTNSLVDVLELTNDQIDNAMFATSHIPKDKRELAIGMYYANRAHAGQERQSGAEYVEHPISAAAMGLHVFEQLENEGYKFPLHVKNMILVLALCHDMTEGTMRAGEDYNAGRKGHYTPLLLDRTESRVEIDNPLHREGADSLRLMTHLRRRKWMPTKSQYYLEGSEDLFFDLVKNLDIHHNSVIEPKKPKTDTKKAEWRELLSIYASSQKEMKKKARELGEARDDGLDWSWTDRWFEIIAEIKQDDVPAMVEHFHEFVGYDYKQAA